MNKCLVVCLILLLLNCLYWIFFKDAPQPVIVSMTTTPQRIGQIKPVIDSLMTQTLLPQKIWIHIPHVMQRDATTFASIPSFLIDNPLVEITRGTDYGPATKVLGMVAGGRLYTNHLVVTIDDDIEYPSDFLQTFANAAKKNPSHIISGQVSYKEDANLSEIIQGFSGVAYQPEHLDQLQAGALALHKDRSCFLADDITLSHWAQKHEIPIKHINYSFNKGIAPLDYGFGQDALMHGANGYGAKDGDMFPGESSQMANQRRCLNFLD